MKTNANTIKALNARKLDLFAGKTVTVGNRAYWANMTTREIYAESVTAYECGIVNGYKVADISTSWIIF